MNPARMLFTARPALACANRNFFASALASANRFALAAALALAWANAAGAQTANPLASGALACATTAAQLPTGALTTGVLVSADGANTGKIFVGGSSVSTASGFPLGAGAGVSLDVTSAALVWFVCQNTTDTLHFIGH